MLQCRPLPVPQGGAGVPASITPKNKPCTTTCLPTCLTTWPLTCLPFSPPPCRQGLGGSIKRFVQQLTGALPVIGLVSRWASTEGGVGDDAQAYPEFSRQVFDAAPVGFQIAVAELQTKYGKVGRAGQACWPAHLHLYLACKACKACMACTQGTVAVEYLAVEY